MNTANTYNNGVSWIPTGSELEELFQQRLQEFREAVRAYLAGNLDPKVFSKTRLALGIYYQNPEVSYMFRIKIPAGLMHADQVDKLAEIGDKYARGLPHISTRQNVQYHYMPIDKAPDIFASLWEAGIETIGASADGARNVTSNPFGGIDPDEVLDTTPYALLVNAFYRFRAYNLHLPKKFKIAVSDGVHDRAQVTINDLGFLAIEQDGEPGFAVYAGGGLGAFPMKGIKVLDFVPANDILIAADAIARVYNDHGERANRKKGRIKFLAKRWGADKFRDTCIQYFAESSQNYGDDLRTAAREWLANEWQEATPVLPADAVDGSVQDRPAFDAWRTSNVFDQKQAGYRAITVKLPLGDLTTNQFRALARIARQYGASIVRATDLQKLVIPFLPEGVLPAVYAELERIGLAEAQAGHISDAVVCAGLDYCTLAVAKSRSFGARVRDYLLEGPVSETQLGLFNLQVSGCPNACGQHSAAHIGATGMMVKDPFGVERPHFSFFIGGRCAGDNSTIGHRIRGRFPESVSPQVVAALANDFLLQRETGEDYADYVARKGFEYFDTIAAPFLALDTSKAA